MEHNSFALTKKHHDTTYTYNGDPQAVCLSASGKLLLVATHKELICFHTDTNDVAWRNSWPAGTPRYSVRIVSSMFKDEFGVYYGDKLNRVDILDHDGKIIEEYATPLFTEIYTSFAITNTHVVLADSFSWQTVQRDETKHVVYEMQFPTPAKDDRYNSYTQPYITQDAQYVVFVKRRSIACYDAFTGELLKIIDDSFESASTITVGIPSGTHFLCNVSDNKLFVHSLPSMDVYYTGKLHTWGNSSAKSYSVKDNFIICHTSSDIALFDMSRDTQNELYDYLWTYNNYHPDISLFHPSKPLIYVFYDGGAELRHVKDYSFAMQPSGPREPIVRLYYNDHNNMLLGWNGSDSILSRVYYIDKDLQPHNTNHMRLPRYDKLRQVAFGNEDIYILEERSQFKFLKHSNYKRSKQRFLSNHLEEVFAVYRGTLIGIGDNKHLQQADMYGNILKTLITDKKKIASQHYMANKAATLWGVKSKLLLVYDFNDGSLTEIKSKVAADCKVFFSSDEREIIIADKSTAEVYNTFTKELLKTIKIKNDLLDMAPDGSLLAVTDNQLTQYDVSTGKKINEFPLETTPLAIAAGNQKLFVTDAQRAIYEYTAPWAAQATYKTVLPAEPQKMSAKELATLIAGINGTDIVRADIPALRAILMEHEMHAGITPDHYRITKELMTGDWLLRHNFEVYNEIKASCESPDGKYILFGSIADTENWDEGGEFMLIEKETGKCVHSRKHVFGGIGWSDDENYFKFSPDGTRLAFLYNGNLIGVTSIHHFDFSVVRFDVTDGDNRPPAFEWLDNDNLAIAAYYKGRLGYFICPVEKDGSCYEGDLEFVITGMYNENNEIVSLSDKQFPANKRLQPATRPDAGIIPGYPFPKDVIKADPAKDNGLYALGVSYSFPVNAEGQWHWLLATADGNIICPEALSSQLDKYVHLVFNNRYAWFYRWVAPGTFNIYEDWKQAARALQL